MNRQSIIVCAAIACVVITMFGVAFISGFAVGKAYSEANRPQIVTVGGEIYGVRADGPFAREGLNGKTYYDTVYRAKKLHKSGL